MKDHTHLTLESHQNWVIYLTPVNRSKNFFPKQTDTDNILEIIQRKVLKGIHLTLTVKEIHAGYFTTPYFTDLYPYLAQNKLASVVGITSPLWGRGSCSGPMVAVDR